MSKTALTAAVLVATMLGFAGGWLARSREEWTWQGPGDVLLVEKHSGETWMLDRGEPLGLLYIGAPQGERVRAGESSRAAPATAGVPPSPSDDEIAKQKRVDAIRRAIERKEREGETRP